MSSINIGEIYTYNAIKPNDNLQKTRPVLVIGTDSMNQLNFVDINYVIISSSADCGKYDVEISEEKARAIGLERRSVIKTTKIFTGPQSKLGRQIGKLPEDIKKDFREKYSEYQKSIIQKL